MTVIQPASKNQHSGRPAPINYLSLCSGIEAASVAWEGLGWHPAAFAQFDPAHDYSRGPDFPSAVLAYHWPDVPNLGDVTRIDGATWRDKIDVLVAGTPCQAFSVAGLRNSLGDARGQLTLRFAELVGEIAPRIVLWENVCGALSTKDNAFGCMLAALLGVDVPLLPAGGSIKWANAGYVSGPSGRAAWRVLDAQHFGVPQRRRRVFLVMAPADSPIDPRAVLFEAEGPRQDAAPARRVGSARTVSLRGREGTVAMEIGNDVATCLRASRGGGDRPYVLVPRPVDFRNLRVGEPDGATGTLQAKATGGYSLNFLPGILASGSIRRVTPTECERLQGFPVGHTDISYRGKRAAESHRYKVLGNSMAVPVMAWLGQRIQAAMIGTLSSFDDKILQGAPRGFATGIGGYGWEGILLDSRRQAGAGAWPNVAEWPNDGVTATLSDVLDAEVAGSYWLSHKARAGLLRRATEKTKAVDPMLISALNGHAEELPVAA